MINVTNEDGCAVHWKWLRLGSSISFTFHTSHLALDKAEKHAGYKLWGSKSSGQNKGAVVESLGQEVNCCYCF